MDLRYFDDFELSINDIRSPLRPTHKEELYKYYNNIPYDSYWLRVDLVNNSMWFLDHRTGNKMYVVRKNMYEGIVLFTGSSDSPYMVVKLLDIDKDQFFRLAQQYVADHGLDWNIVPPLSWDFHNLGLHVTINTNIDILNHTVGVRLGNVVHFSSLKSNWVAIEVELDGITCPQKCHVSIGQEKL